MDRYTFYVRLASQRNMYQERRFFQFENLDEAVVREVMVQTGPIQHAVFSVRQNYCKQFGKNA